MSIEINIHQALRHLMNKQSKVEVNGATVDECLADRERVKADFLLLCAITLASGVLLKRDTPPP